jgi:membrane protein DedA with SNARE-associated domain
VPLFDNASVVKEASVYVVPFIVVVIETIVSAIAFLPSEFWHIKSTAEAVLK